MKKICFVLVAIVMLSGLFIATGEAGQLCWQLDFPNNSDMNGYLSMTASGGKWTRSLHGAWYQQGSMYWPMAGNMVTYKDGDRWFLQLNTALMGGYFGLMAAVSTDTLSGEGQLVLIADSRTMQDVTLTKISCKQMPPYVAP